MENMEQINNLTEENISQYQLESLQHVLNRAYKRVNFYKNVMDKKGIMPEQIEKTSDLSLLPFTTRDDLALNYPYNFFAVPLRDIVRLHTLKMPFGNPVIIGYTKSDIETRRLLFAQFFKSCAIGQEDIIQIYLEKGMAVWGSELKEGAEYLGALTIPPDPLNLQSLLMVMRDFKTTALITTPTAMQNILHEIQKNEIPVAGLSLKKILFIGEYLDKNTRNQLKDRLSVDCYSFYGLIELGGPCAFECEAQNGLHIAMEHFIPEIIDPLTGENLPAGSEGELVLTTLRSKANPLIRFRTGDITSIILQRCDCGRHEWRIAPVSKTSDKRVNIRGIKINLFQIKDFLRNYNMHQTRYLFVARDFTYKKEPELWLVMDNKNFSGSLPQLHKLLLTMETDFEDIFGLYCSIKPVELSALEQYKISDRLFLEIKEDIK
jgi:phenylacetate-CoA ligase